jgi:hypothetical protein
MSDASNAGNAIRRAQADREELQGDVTTVNGRMVTWLQHFDSPIGAISYWTVECFPLGWPKPTPAVVEMSRIDRATRAEVEAKAADLLAQLARRRPAR